MPRKTIKCTVEVDIHVVTCPSTFLRDHEYLYVHMEMLGLEARTKSVPATFPLLLHERLKFERTFFDTNDPHLVSALLKNEDIIIELRQHTDYVTDGKVVAHCSSNTHEFLYPSISHYFGPVQEIILFKTSNFKPIRNTGEAVKLEFTSKTDFREVPDYKSSPRRSPSPRRKVLGASTTVEPLPSKYPMVLYHGRTTDPLHTRALNTLQYAYDDMDLAAARRRQLKRSRSLTSLATSPNLTRSLSSSQRVQTRVDDLLLRKGLYYNQFDSDVDLDVLRDLLREERNTLNEAIKEADREAYYRSYSKPF